MKSKFEKWTGVLALAFGALALVLAWQANKIAKDANEMAQAQMLPNVMMIGVGGSGGGGGKGNANGGLDAYCWSRVQLANVGGAPTAIIGFTGNVMFLDEEIRLEKYQANWIRSRKERLFDVLHSFNVTMEPVETWPASPSYDPLGTFPQVTMPIEIQANSSVNLLFVVRYVADPPFHGGTFTYQSSDFPDLRKSPMNIAYQIDLADGSSLSVPQTDCQWFRVD